MTDHVLEATVTSVAIALDGRILGVRDVRRPDGTAVAIGSVHVSSGGPNLGSGDRVRLTAYHHANGDVTTVVEMIERALDTEPAPPPSETSEATRSVGTTVPPAPLQALAEALRLPAAIEAAKALWRAYSPHAEVVGWDAEQAVGGGVSVVMRVRLGPHETDLSISGVTDEPWIERVVEAAWERVAFEAAKEWRP